MSGYRSLHNQGAALTKLSSATAGKAAVQTAGGLKTLAARILMGKPVKSGPYADAAKAHAKRVAAKTGQPVPVRYPRRVPRGDAAKGTEWKQVDEKAWQRLRNRGDLPSSHFDKRGGSAGATSYYVRKATFSPRSVAGFAEKYPGAVATGALGAWLLKEPTERKYKELMSQVPKSRDVYYPPGSY